MKPVVLLILDGFGISENAVGNASYHAKTPNFDYVSEYYKGVPLQASGLEVGLSWGEMGSSEVGHANLGAGLVVYQNLERINLAIKDGTFLRLPIWKEAVRHAVDNSSTIHLMGLVSNGGVHAHLDHISAILEGLQLAGFRGRLLIHVFTDGQDVAPQSAPIFLEKLAKELDRLGIGQIATVMGRYYAMDKGDNWDRVQKAYECLVNGQGNPAKNFNEVMDRSYRQGIKDEEFLPAVIVGDGGKPLGTIGDNDVVLFFNFRADRAREITRAFVDPAFNAFPRRQLSNLLFISMSDYGLPFSLPIVFPPQKIPHPLAEVLARNNKAQLHVAEKEKYAHVTYFFNGGTEEPYAGEERVIIPSKSVASYALAPEMSAYEIADRIVAEIQGGKYDLLVVNFANGDIIGHTGNFEAGVRAVEVLDDCLGKILREVLKVGGALVVTADHGNVEEMINLKTGEMDKEHSTNPVPFWVVAPGFEWKGEGGPQKRVEPSGILADAAPTVLKLMGLEKPAEMTGASLLQNMSRCAFPKNKEA